MIQSLVPSSVIVVESEVDILDIKLFPQEQAILGRAVEQRRRDFVTGRACARQALARLGVEPCAIGSGRRGEPVWPYGVVGSITHCRAYRASAVASADEIIAVGIDAEVHQPLSVGVVAEIATKRERTWLAAQRTSVHLDRLLFSAKESLYKAWFPLTQRWLDFGDAEVCIDLGGGTFGAHVAVRGPPVGGKPLTTFRGRWAASDAVVATAVTVR